VVDTDYFLPPLMQNYFLQTEAGRARKDPFFATEATTDFGNAGMSYGELILINAEAIMANTAPFAQSGGQTPDNLIHLKDGQVVGEWRDSTYGIGGGRIPYNINTALVPAALRSIAALADAGYFPSHPEWAEAAAANAQVWEDNTLQFFEVVVPQAEAVSLVENYTTAAGFGFPSESDKITTDVVFHGLSLEGNNDIPLVRVMNSDDCFRHFMTNTTNQTQLTSFLNQSANNILAPYPVGLLNPVGLLIANPAYGGEPVYAANFSNNAYHGTVVWSWQLAMMAKGLEHQLGRCEEDATVPDFCSDESVRTNVLNAYNALWDNIEANDAYINSEVWSWLYQDGDFVFEPLGGFHLCIISRWRTMMVNDFLGALPPPAGVNPTESNVRQLWSL
jgi:hypothetical protein